MKRQKRGRNRDHSVYEFRDGKIRITSYIEIDRDSLFGLLCDRASERDYSLREAIGCVTYLVEDHDASLDMRMLPDGALRVEAIVETEIADQVVHRHRLLFAALCACGGWSKRETFEDMCANLAVGVPYRPEEHIKEIAHPPWEHYSDLEFAQVLFWEPFDLEWSAWCPWEHKPYTYEFVEVVTDAKQLSEDARRWARERELPEDVIEAMVRAALRLNAVKVGRLGKPFHGGRTAWQSDQKDER